LYNKRKNIAILLCNILGLIRKLKVCQSAKSEFERGDKGATLLGFPLRGGSAEGGGEV
jgi:hypothetical protein